MIWDSLTFSGFDASGNAAGAVANFTLTGNPGLGVPHGSNAFIAGHLLYTGPEVQCSIHTVYSIVSSSTSSANALTIIIAQDAVPIFSLNDSDDPGGGHSVDATPIFTVAAGVNSLIEVQYAASAGSIGTMTLLS